MSNETIIAKIQQYIAELRSDIKDLETDYAQTMSIETYYEGVIDTKEVCANKLEAILKEGGISAR